MALNANLLRGTIQKTLTPLGLYSPAAEELLMATCAQESLLGTFRVQVGGPALGIFQMEPDTYMDIWKNYLAYHQLLGHSISSLSHDPALPPSELILNDPYAVALARVQYLRAPGALPPAEDLDGLWLYYKQYYNTPGGAATQDDFNRHYHALVNGVAK